MNSPRHFSILVLLLAFLTAIRGLFVIFGRDSMLLSKLFPRCFLSLASSVFILCGSQVFAEDEPSAEEVTKWEKKAQQGDAVSQYILGMSYVTTASEQYSTLPRGWTIYSSWIKFSEERLQYNAAESAAQKNSIAAAWFLKAADQGHAGAQYQLGCHYTKGCYVPPGSDNGEYYLNFKGNPIEAASMYHKAASQGNADAQYALGRCYSIGEGVPKNDTEQVKWLLKAAQQGNAKSQEMLGICFAKGEGVDLDNITAYMWFNLSIAAGNTDAAERRDRMTDRMTPKQIAKGQKLSSEWKPQ